MRNKLADSMSEFIQRHIGPSESEQRKMLADLGLSTIDELVREIVPDSILLRGDSNLPYQRDVANKKHLQN